MRLSDSINTIDCRFLLNAGSAESNPTLSAVFNQYRSNALESFIEEYNTITSNIPGDIVLLVTIRLPVIPTQDKVLFDIKTPSLKFFFKKAAVLHTFSNNTFVMLELPALLLVQHALLKSCLDVTSSSLNQQVAKTYLKSFFHSLKSYSSVLSRKNFMFFLCTFKFNSNTFYKLELTRSFKRFFNN